MAKGRRVELNAISGIRFWATLFMVLGRSVETLWIDKSGQSLWLSMYTCSVLRRVADDLVCFYFVLSGFTISWGYMTRDFESGAVRRRYWIGRLQRFYPDFFISTSFTILIKREVFFGCHPLSRMDWVYNLAQLALVGGWVCWLPFASNLNGPSWFLITLVWLWFLYPWLVRPVRDSFSGNPLPLFLAKLVGLWVLSLIPWLFVLGFMDSYESLGFWSLDKFIWAVKPFPLFRLPEFVMGMALAVRLSQDPEYTEIPGGSDDSGWRRPGSIALWTWAGGVAAVAGFAVAGAMVWDPACECLAVGQGCYGWLQLIDTRFALLSALAIYAIAGLDAAAAAAAAPDDAGQAAAVRAAAGPAGVWVWQALCWWPFQEANKWGLQVFLYQCPIQIVFQAFLVDIGFGLKDRCAFQDLDPIFATFYVVWQAVLTYLTAWVFHEKGPLGTPIHAAAKKLASDAIAMLDGAESPPPPPPHTPPLPAAVTTVTRQV